MQVANTASFFGTFLTIYTTNVAALVTNSTSYSTLDSVVMTTTANALAGTAVVEGAGEFVIFQTSTPNTTTIRVTPGSPPTAPLQSFRPNLLPPIPPVSQFIK